MSERIMTLSVSFGNDDAVAAKIGDFCGVLTGLHYVGDLLGAQLRDYLRRQFILEWPRRLERGEKVTSFLALRRLAPATSRSTLHERMWQADPVRPSSRLRHAAADLPPFLPSRNRFAPLFAGTG
jgi:hypothetical protein